MLLETNRKNFFLNGQNKTKQAVVTTLSILGAFLATRFLLLQFPMQTLVFISLAFVFLILLTRMHPTSAALLLVVLSITPIEGILGGIPFISRLNRYAQPVLTLGFLVLSLLILWSSSRDQENRIETQIKPKFIVLVGALAIPGIVAGFPSSLSTLIQLFNCALVAFVILKISTFPDFRLNFILDKLATAIGVYSVVLIIWFNPMSLLRDLSAENFIGDAVISNPNRLAGFGDDYELLAQFLAIGCVLLVNKIRNETGIQRLWTLILLGSTFFSLMATASLFGIFCGAAGVLVTNQFSKKHNKARFSFLPLVLLVLLAGTIQQIATSRLEARDLTFSDIGQLISDPARFLNRSSVWDRVVSDPDFQFVGLTGLGWPYPIELFGTYPHNMFLAVYISGGIAALLAYTGFWIQALAKSVKLVVSRTSIHIGTSALIILSGNVLNEISRLGSYMTFAATIFALTYIADKERQES